MINFDTNNLIIVCYPQFAGGKFLINCLGLSDLAVFQDITLVKDQLNGKFNQLNKIDHLRNKISKIRGQWNDLDLGCEQLFGINNIMYYQFPSEIIKLSISNDVLDTISNGTLKFFIVAHYPLQCDAYRNVWPDAKIIYFTNCKNFILLRKWRRNKWYLWNTIRGNSWPINPPQTFEEYSNLPQSIKEELELVFNFNDYIYLKHHEDMYDNYLDHYNWNTDNYFSEDTTVNEIKKLYQLLNLTSFNEDIIREYYKLWINKLRELS